MRIATGDEDFRLRSVAVDATDAGSDVLVGGRGNGTRVQDNDGGLLGREGPVQSAFEQFMLDGGAVGLGGAAPEVFNEEAGHGAIIPAENGWITARGCDFHNAVAKIRISRFSPGMFGR